MNDSKIKAYRLKLQKTIDYLKRKNKILFIITSNRWSGEAGGEKPKSTELAHLMQKKIGPKKVVLLDVTKLNIVPCEGNVSTRSGNVCGLLKAKLNDKRKNPTGEHRCWASFNNPDDELWKISKELFNSDAVVFFGSVRWGQMNSFYQKLIERLTWLENRHTTLGENNIIKNIDAGIIITGHNWRGAEVLKTQQEVLAFYGFRTPQALSWNWQYLDDSGDESNKSYQEAGRVFHQTFFE